MNEKNRQDTLKNTPEYNPALRELCKLFSNCLSGKVIQKNYEDIFQRVDNSRELKNTLEKIEGNKFYVYKHGNIHYVEGKLKKELTYRGDVMNTGVYGCLEEEVGDANKSIMLAPKSYCVINETESKKCKIKFKGVRKDDRYVLEDELWKPYKEMTQDDIEKVIKEKSYHKCNTYEMFEHLYNGKEIYVFQSQLTKTKGVKNNILNDKYKESKFAIRQTYLIKKIRPP
jgi:hypothetical protein